MYWPLRTGVYNPRPARLCYAAHGHMCKVYNTTITQYGRLGVPLVVVFKRVAREPAYNNGWVPFQRKVVHPCIWSSTFSH